MHSFFNPYFLLYSRKLFFLTIFNTEFSTLNRQQRSSGKGCDRHSVMLLREAEHQENDVPMQ